MCIHLFIVSQWNIEALGILPYIGQQKQVDHCIGKQGDDLLTWYGILDETNLIKPHGSRTHFLWAENITFCSLVLLHVSQF